MRPYKKVFRILLILSAIKFTLAAPVPVQEIYEIRAHVLDIAGDRTTASQTRPDLSINGVGRTNGPPSLGSSDSGHQWEQDQHNTRSRGWETPEPPNPEPPTPSPGSAGDDSHSSSLLPTSAHDTPPQAHPDPLASSSAHDFINPLFDSSPSSGSVPGSAHDTPPQADPDPVAGLSAQNPIDLVSSSSTNSESTPGSPLDTHPQAHSDPLTPSSAHGIADSDLPPPSPGPTDNLLRPVPPSASIGPHPLPSAESPNEDSEMVDLEHPPPASPSNPGPSTGPLPPPIAEPPHEDSAKFLTNLEKLLKSPSLRPRLSGSGA
jgi:hypothetical protein